MKVKNMRQRVLINLVSQPSEYPTGIARTCFALLEALMRRDNFEFVIRTTYPSDKLPIALTSRDLKVFTVRSPYIHFFSIISQTFSSRRFCKKNNIDAVINIDNICSLIYGTPSIVIAHDIYTYAIPEFYSKFQRWKDFLIWSLLGIFSDFIACNSKSTLKDLSRYVPMTASKLEVVYLDSGMVEKPRHAVESCPAVQGDYVLVVGAPSPNKNFSTIARAMVLVAERFPGIRIVHVGHDPAEVLRNCLVGAPPLEVVRFSHITDSILENLFRNAVCMVNASLAEGFCLPIIEAQRNWCPVVCSDRSAAGEVSGDGALKCDPEDHQAIACLIIRLMESASLRDEMRENGILNAARFSWDVSAMKIEHMLERLLAKRRK